MRTVGLFFVSNEGEPAVFVLMGDYLCPSLLVTARWFFIFSFCRYMRVRALAMR